VASSGEKADRSGVQSVEQGLRVARVFVASAGPLALRDVARAAGLGPSAAHRYLVSLVRAGLLVQVADGRYDLGSLALQLGFAGLSRMDAVEVAAAHLRRFVNETGTTAMLSVWSDRGPLVVRWLQGARPVFTTISVGSLMPLGTSATGRVFQAFGATAPPRANARRSPPARIARTAEAATLARIAEVRTAGFATVAGDLVPGLYAVAVPVLDGTGTLAVVLTAVSAGSGLKDQTIAALRRTAVEASAALGHVPREPQA